MPAVSPGPQETALIERLADATDDIQDLAEALDGWIAASKERYAQGDYYDTDIFLLSDTPGLARVQVYMTNSLPFTEGSGVQVSYGDDEACRGRLQAAAAEVGVAVVDDSFVSLTIVPDAPELTTRVLTAIALWLLRAGYGVVDFGDLDWSH